MMVISPEQLLTQLKWRYATKMFDPERRIDDGTWNALEETLVLTPSSFGLQPWLFYVITDQKLKETLVPAAYGQAQIRDCSHLVVMTVKKTMTVEDVDAFMDSIEAIQGRSRESTEGYRNVIVRAIVEGMDAAQIVQWAKLQSYIALGNFMTAAALLGVDTCPMEGFSAPKFDEALGLAARGLTTAVLCPAGYRSSDDKYAVAPKVRYPVDDMIVRIE